MNLSSFENDDLVFKQICEALYAGKNFRVEAGAGSGKTFSLKKVIDWIGGNKINELKKSGKKVICITYTNAAVNEIKSRIGNSMVVMPTTIHSFAWISIKNFQKALLDISNEKGWIKETNIKEINSVQYTIGVRSIENGTFFLGHDDVIELFVELMSFSKFRKLLSDKNAIILVDEYQDTNKKIIKSFLDFYINKGIGPQFGFFGDSWQTIYNFGIGDGLLDNKNIVEIKKSVNFRSSRAVVDVLNKLRPNLPQQALETADSGVACVIDCNDFSGNRVLKGVFKDDLPSEELHLRIDSLIKKIKSKYNCKDESIKILMLTHRVLAKQQGFDRIFAILNNEYKNRTDDVLNFIYEIVEPVFTSLESNDITKLFDVLKSNKIIVESKSDKRKWQKLKTLLQTARKKRCIDVLQVIIDSKIINIPDKILNHYNCYFSDKKYEYAPGYTVNEYLNIDYSEFLLACASYSDNSIYSTEHGAKGLEYDNVIFVVGGGWNLYRYDRQLPKVSMSINDCDEALIRNRNLFYVSCSRAKLRLFIMVTIPVNADFYAFLKNIVGTDLYKNYNDFINE